MFSALLPDEAGFDRANASAVGLSDGIFSLCNLILKVSSTFRLFKVCLSALIPLDLKLGLEFSPPLRCFQLGHERCKKKNNQHRSFLPIVFVPTKACVQMIS